MTSCNVNVFIQCRKAEYIGNDAIVRIILIPVTFSASMFVENYQSFIPDHYNGSLG